MYQAITFNNYSPTLGDLEKAGVEIFNDWWETYIPEHRETLIRKILHTYHFYQIGSETPERFVYNLNAQLERIMPYYNQLYKSELIKIDPMLNHAIQSNGRNIENILTKANTTDDKFSKSIRDFVGMTDKASDGQTDTENKNTRDTVGESTTNYNKEIIEHTDDFNVEDKAEKEHTTTAEKMVDSVTETGTEITHVDETHNMTKDVTENPGQVTTKTMDWGQTETGTKKLVGNTVSDGSGTKNWTETRDDDSTTDTDTNLVESTSGHSQKDYADTPQVRLDNSGEDGNSAVRRDYLTNVTWVDESSQHKADTTQHQVFKDDEIRTHDEDTTDKKTTDNTENTETNNAKGGTDTETSKLSGVNTTNTVQKDTGTSDTDKSINKSTNDIRNTDTTKDRDLTMHGTDDRDIDKTTNETGSSSTNTVENMTETSSGNVKEHSNEKEQVHENANVSQTSAANQEKKTEETKDAGSTNITSGFMNVSSSALLNAFRDTFLNIDNMIIEELRDNFMMIY